VIVGSLLLILVAVGLLVAGVLGGSNALIVCCIVVVILAAIVLVLGVKQSAAVGVAYGHDIDGEAEVTGEYPLVATGLFRSRQSDRRAGAELPSLPASSRRADRAASVGSAPTAELGQVLIEEQRTGRGIPSQGTPPYGDTPSRHSHAAPDDDELYDPPVPAFDAPAFETPAFEAPVQETPTYETAAYETLAYEAAAHETSVAYRDDTIDPATAADMLDPRDVVAMDAAVRPADAPEFGAHEFETPEFVATEFGAPEFGAREFEAQDFGAQDFGARDDFDEDPPDEPSAQIVSPANAARVAMLSTDVLVVDGRPRYHVVGCVHLHGRETEPLPVGEAVELGFTPCALCEPDSALLADARRV
jgi:hypothetical protein